MARIGLFLCYCSLSPLQLAAAEEIAGIIGEHRGIICTGICPDMCSDPGQELMRKAKGRRELTR